MEDFDLNIVAKKSIQGVFALVSRTFIIQILQFVANLVLSLYLDPASFGVFFVASSIIVFLNYFQDIGLAASLIQKKENPTVQELRTTFTIQQILVLAVIIPTVIFSRPLADFYNLNTNGYFLFLAMIVSFFLSSLRTVPTVILERKLDFKKLVIPQIVENVLYYTTLIVLAISGFGVTSFTVAVILRSVAGLILTYIIQPWEIGFSFHGETFKKLISFGLPFQMNSILGLLKDDLLVVYIGKILPLSQVGYVGFSQKWAFFPLRLIMDNVIKITFPSFSRLQHNKEALKVAIEKSLFLISFLIFPIVVAIIFFSPYILTFIPRLQKWEPALLSLSFFALNTVFSSISTPLTNFLNAIGKVKVTLYFMIGWTALTWILTPVFISLYGFNGVAIASFFVSISSVFVFIVVKKYVAYSFLKPVARQFIAAVCMALFIVLTQSIITNIWLLGVEMILAGSVYLLLLYLIAKQELVRTLHFIIRTVRKE